MAPKSVYEWSWEYFELGIGDVVMEIGHLESDLAFRTRLGLLVLWRVREAHEAIRNSKPQRPVILVWKNDR